MPTKTKTKPAAEQAPKTKRRYAYKPTRTIAAYREGNRERLKELIETFMEKSWPEEQMFMLEILNNWDNGKGGFHRGPRDVSPPLFPAIVSAIDGASEEIVLLPNGKMLGPVEDYIASLLKQGVPYEPEMPASEIRKRRLEDLKCIFELEFASDATGDDIYFLEGVLSHWQDISRLDPKERPECPLQSAFQMEVDRENWLLSVPDYKAPHAVAVVKMMQEKTWLSNLLSWIGSNGIDKLSPCLIASKAAAMQQAFEEQRKAAA